MPRQNRKHASPRRSGGRGKSAGQKVGSDPKAVESVGGQGDFGVAAGDEQSRAERLIASRETKHRDKGTGGYPPRSGSEGQRTSGVGGPDSGTGSSSGGDIDTDIIGVGTGGSGIAQAPPAGRTTGRNITEGEPFGEPADQPGRQRSKRQRKDKNRVTGGRSDEAGGADEKIREGNPDEDREKLFPPESKRGR